MTRPIQVPDSEFVMVPREPTPEMIGAMAITPATSTHKHGKATTHHLGMAGAEEAYAAMLAAAPSAPQEGRDEDRRETDETAWLVEYDGKMLAALGVPQGECIQYLSVRNKRYGAGELTLDADPGKALRFARKQDAEAALTVYAGHTNRASNSWIGNYLHAREHAWPEVAREALSAHTVVEIDGQTEKIARDLLRELIILRDQVEQFCIQYGEADFYIGGANEAIKNAVPLFGNSYPSSAPTEPAQARVQVVAAQAGGEQREALDFRDVIYNPTRYTVDGSPLLSARLKLETKDGTVYIHRHDYGLQRQRISDISRAPYRGTNSSGDGTTPRSESDAKDAARYRWLVANAFCYSYEAKDKWFIKEHGPFPTLSAAIDAAMSPPPVPQSDSPDLGGREKPVHPMDVCRHGNNRHDCDHCKETL